MSLYTLSSSNTALLAFLFEGERPGEAIKFSWFKLMYQQGLRDLSTAEK